MMQILYEIAPISFIWAGIASWYAIKLELECKRLASELHELKNN